jgi:hypothetical protein
LLSGIISTGVAHDQVLPERVATVAKFPTLSAPTATQVVALGQLTDAKPAAPLLSLNAVMLGVNDQVPPESVPMA